MDTFHDESVSLSNWDYFTFPFLRPVVAVFFTLALLFVGWLLAWKLVLVHVPLVQEIFGLRKKTAKPKPAGRRRYTEFYNRINAQNPSSDCYFKGQPNHPDFHCKRMRYNRERREMKLATLNRPRAEGTRGVL